MIAASAYPRYEGAVYRPPSEADSLILQVMYGCSYDKCTFCGMYTEKPFRVRPFAEVEEDIENLAPWLRAHVSTVFLADGDAMALPARSMVRILESLRGRLPNLKRVSSYANAQSLLRHSAKDLREMREQGLEMLYIGLESGDDETLARVCKAVTVAQQTEACRKAREAGFGVSVMAILGLGGVDRSLEHARATGRALSAIDPDYASMLSLMLAQGAPLAEAVARGEFVVPDALGMLRELREVIAATEVTHTVFRTTHASNYLPLQGTLPEDKQAMLEVVDHVLVRGDKTLLRPEYLRGF